MVISAMRPSSITTLALATGLGSTQSINVALVSTKRISTSQSTVGIKRNLPGMTFCPSAQGSYKPGRIRL